ncbi:hypothetical protein TNCV_4912901 [Trichonephila clavipes]|nr:hypothetical protein TNCV_4912901 [Trichonephila clavipes]
MTSARGHGAIVYCLNSGSDDSLTDHHNVLHRCLVMSVQRFLKLEESLELLNNLDSDENDVEIAVLPPGASAYGVIIRHMARETSLHPISDK